MNWSRENVPPLRPVRLVLCLIPFMAVMLFMVNQIANLIGKGPALVVCFTAVLVYVCWITERWYLFFPLWIAAHLSLLVTFGIVAALGLE